MCSSVYHLKSSSSPAVAQYTLGNTTDNDVRGGDALIEAVFVWSQLEVTLEVLLFFSTLTSDQLPSPVDPVYQVTLYARCSHSLLNFSGLSSHHLWHAPFQQLPDFQHLNLALPLPCEHNSDHMTSFLKILSLHLQKKNTHSLALCTGPFRLGTVLTCPVSHLALIHPASTHAQAHFSLQESWRICTSLNKTVLTHATLCLWRKNAVHPGMPSLASLLKQVSSSLQGSAIPDSRFLSRNTGMSSLEQPFHWVQISILPLYVINASWHPNSSAKVWRESLGALFIHLSLMPCTLVPPNKCFFNKYVVCRHTEATLWFG